MSEKRVRTIDDIVFEEAGVTLPKGTVYVIGGVTERGIILEAPDGERWMIDPATFESGFEIAP